MEERIRRENQRDGNIRRTQHGIAVAGWEGGRGPEIRESKWLLEAGKRMDYLLET